MKILFSVIFIGLEIKLPCGVISKTMKQIHAWRSPPPPPKDFPVHLIIKKIVNFTHNLILSLILFNSCKLIVYLRLLPSISSK